MKSFKSYKQADSMDCGPTCLRMVAKHKGKSYSLQYLREICHIDRQGVSLKGLSYAAEKIGLRSLVVKLPFIHETEASLYNAPLPAIAHWNQNHFVVVIKATPKHVWIADPASGKFKLTREDFEKSWISDNRKGILLLLEETPDFHSIDTVDQKWNLGYIFRYLRPYRKLLLQLGVGLLLGVVFQLIFPFLTQSIVDFGIQNQNINFVYLILIAQLVLFGSQTAVQFIQSWILLHMSTRINVSLLSDFLIKLMKLPLGFFDSKNIGDLMQRINDHKRIESFLTGSTLNVLFSSLNLLVFGTVLLIYSYTIFTIFIVGAILYILWILIFLKKRKEIDYLAFQQYSENTDMLYEIIQGMPEIKLQNSEYKRRWKWAHIQASLFNTSIKTLTITQYQDAGGYFINQLKNILISFVAAKSVIDGNMTLGMMMAIQYIVGQVNSPLKQMLGFIRSAQDAKIALERLGEIHNTENEATEEQTATDFIPDGDIEIKNLSFSYTPISENVLTDINMTIPTGKMTAIVGTSGSGKTTLVKLLLGFYPPSEGTIKIGGTSIDTIRQSLWRANTGAVLQEGYIFSDTIANNIAESDDTVDKAKLLQSVKTANIQDFIESSPLGYNTVIGSKGGGISQGQKQRLLIARAVYKEPEILFFDEATNSLDANNEKTIMENLDVFFEGRTVVVVAHRLSTVKNAYQIIVLEKGNIIERGNHEELVEKKGAYYTLVKNQLELGS